MAPPTVTSLKSCNSPGCTNFGVMNRESLRECAKCKTATYCNRDCQRAHWPVHKQFCTAWSATAVTNGEDVRDIKKKMNEFMWLIRGVPEYTDDMFTQYIASIREGCTGFMDFLFGTLEELDEAIRVLQSLPVVGKGIFHTMPMAPGHQENPDGKPITLRKRHGGKRAREFRDAVEKKLAFVEPDLVARPNLINLLRMAGSSERIFVLGVTMRLGGTFSTHSYDFLFKDVSWNPEEAPPPKRLAIEAPNAFPPRQRKISMD
ncbi:hypothetical protein C8R43DRAFT_1011941 [Mycena crocata]|nr:hypothetical protein C8R43DRAFT_1011941 [Mycena crocata]